MIIDLVKLFPKSCEQLKITDLKVNTNDIAFYSRVVSTNTAGTGITEDVIQLHSGAIHRFPAIDTGLFIINGIDAANQTLKEIEENVDDVSIAEQKTQKNHAVNYLQMIASLYS